MRLLTATAMGLLLVCHAGCMNRGNRRSEYRQLTGTCAGVCDHYRVCKGEQGSSIGEEGYRACVVECAEVFSSTESLRAFESLACDDAVAFVEGSSGRGPGILLSDAP